MKKFFAISLISHTALLAYLLVNFHAPRKEQNQKSYVTISLSKKSYVTPKKVVKKKINSKTIKQKTLKTADIKADSKEVQNNEASLEQTQASKAEQIQTEKLSYKEELYHFIKNKNHYPPIAAKLKHSGEVRVKIKINKLGQFESVSLISPSSFKTLNEGTISFLNKVAQFKPLPDELNTETFEVPIVYEL